MYFILTFFVSLHLKFNVVYILYVTVKLFLVCHTLSFLETNVPVVGEAKGSGEGKHFIGRRLGQKLNVQNAYKSMFCFEN